MGIQLSKTKGGYLSFENPKKQLMKMLVEKTRDVGHVLSFREACEDPDMIDPNNYAFYFGSFREAAKLAWKEANGNPQGETNTSQPSTVQIIPNSKKSLPKDQPNRPPTSSGVNMELPLTDLEIEQFEAEDYLDDEPYESDSLDSSQYLELSSSNKKKSRTQKYTREQLKGQIIAFYRRNGRMPSQTDVASDPNMPSWATLYKHLGHKSEWVKLIPQELREEPSLSDVTQAPSEQVSEGGGVRIITSHRWRGNALFVEVAINRPDRIDPILITLSV